MYLDYEVKIPDSRHGITWKTIRGITYIYYTYDRKYSSDKHYTVPKNTTIGKCLDASAETMYPNTNFLKYFPEAELPETRKVADRSACFRIGAFIVIRKVIAEYHLDEIIGRLIGKEAGLLSKSGSVFHRYGKQRQSVLSGLCVQSFAIYTGNEAVQ